MIEKEIRKQTYKKLKKKKKYMPNILFEICQFERRYSQGLYF